MKHLLLTTIAAVLLVGCGTTQQSAQAPELLAAAAPIQIHFAVMSGDIEAVKKHLAAGEDVNARGIMGWTPLAFAANKELAALLIAKGADVNAKNDFGVTPLYGAASGGHKEVAELLIANGADVNVKSNFGETPLDLAVTEDKPETADLLRKHGGKTGEELKAEGK